MTGVGVPGQSAPWDARVPGPRWQVRQYESEVATLLRSDQPWRLHSCFRRAINLAVGQGLTERWVSILVGGARGPARIHVAEPDHAWLIPDGLADMPVRWEERRLLLLRPAGSCWLLELPDEGGYELPPVGRLELTEPVRRAGCRQLGRLLRDAWRASPPGRGELALVRRLGLLRRAVHGEEPERLTRLLPRILGLGEGLTPSGDDLLLGLLAVLDARRASCGPARGAHARLLAALGASDLATTPAGRQQLLRAMEGRYFEPLLALVAQLERAAEHPVDARELLAVGATSGRSILLGVLLGLGAG